MEQAVTTLNLDYHVSDYVENRAEQANLDTPPNEVDWLDRRLGSLRQLLRTYQRLVPDWRTCARPTDQLARALHAYVTAQMTAGDHTVGFRALYNTLKALPGIEHYDRGGEDQALAAHLLEARRILTEPLTADGLAELRDLRARFTFSRYGMGPMAPEIEALLRQIAEAACYGPFTLAGTTAAEVVDLIRAHLRNSGRLLFTPEGDQPFQVFQIEWTGEDHFVLSGAEDACLVDADGMVRLAAELLPLLRAPDLIQTTLEGGTRTGAFDHAAWTAGLPGTLVTIDGYTGCIVRTVDRESLRLDPTDDGGIRAHVTVACSYAARA